VTKPSRDFALAASASATAFTLWAPVTDVTSANAAECTGSVGPGIAPPATVPSGLPGFHAHSFGQSGYPTLCPGRAVDGHGRVLHASLSSGWPRYNRVAAEPADYVGPNQVSWFRFKIQTPQAPGTYKLYIRPLIEGRAVDGGLRRLLAGHSEDP